ncbi:hypothetical protein [Priestia flexa]|uniref:FbpB family small basic protein n=1 Tax=Priestia flexa TaxID=86664 RepID=A0ABU4J4C6_9BACI|nr:hypothetical protein [Priestia flexa]MDW8515857.1 hypothetical protein [Priestia flexa]
MFRKHNNDLFKKIAKNLYIQEVEAQQTAKNIQKDIDTHKEMMKKRRESFNLIRNK